MKKLFQTSLFLFFMVACSTIKLGYNNADWILPWMVGNYFDLNAEQESFVKDKIAQHLRWHRYTELPRYSRLIDEATYKIRDGLSSEEYDWIANELKQSYAKLVEQILPDAADMLLSLNPDQIEYIESNIAKKNKERAERPKKSEQERLKNREEKIIERTEDWVGDLSDDQIKIIRELSHILPNNLNYYNEDRIRRQQVFLNLLKSKPAKDEFINQFRIYLVDYNAGRPKELVEQSRQYWEASKQLTLNIAQILTDQQKRNASERIREYQVDFTELASSE